MTQLGQLPPPLPAPRVAAEIRRSARITQAELATALGVHRVTVAKYERGALRPRGANRDRYRALLAEMADRASVA